MSKVIIKVNSFMETKEFTNVCNFIYNQYKERDIVVVPPYCDVYVVDGAEIEVQKKDRYSGKSVEKVCSTCKHAVPMDAAHECMYLNDCHHYEHWEAKDE